MRIKRLLYRRQFILGSRFLEYKDWNRTRINKNLYLSSHPDLEIVQTRHNGIQLTLLGYIIDPFQPDYSNHDILVEINKNSKTFNDLILQVEHCGGRWIILYNDGSDVSILHDPCGLRQIFYCKKDNELWCASQASTLADLLQIELDTDKSVQEFIQSPLYEQMERLWPGDGSSYKGIKHVMPNHFLDLNTGQTKRYWPRKPIEQLHKADAIQMASKILQGSLLAAANRYEIMLPITAGWDSRALLAASKAISKNTFYYISLHPELGVDAADVTVPKRLMSGLGLEFNVIPYEKTMDQNFLAINRKNVGMRDVSKSFIIYQHYLQSQGKINISGNCSEIMRESYFDYHPHRKYTGRFLAKVMGYPNSPFAAAQYQKWLEECEQIVRDSNIYLLNFFYWEQRVGNWGAMYPAEQDIAIEEFCPFNNRAIITTLLSVDFQFRTEPKNILYRELIKNMWEETLFEPINPPTLSVLMKYKTKELLRNSFQMYLKISGRIVPSLQIR